MHISVNARCHGKMKYQVVLGRYIVDMADVSRIMALSSSLPLMQRATKDECQVIVRCVASVAFYPWCRWNKDYTLL